MVLLAHRLLAAFAALHQRIGDVMGTDMTDKKRTRNELEAAISHGLRHSQSAEETWPKEDFDATLARANSLPMFSPATQQAEPVSDSEMAALDSVIYGGYVTLDGKRIDPTSVYAAPPADDEAVELLEGCGVLLKAITMGRAGQMYPRVQTRSGSMIDVTQTIAAIDAYLAKVQR